MKEWKDAPDGIGYFWVIEDDSPPAPVYYYGMDKYRHVGISEYFYVSREFRRLKWLRIPEPELPGDEK